MILAVDVDYRDENLAKVAGVLFKNWSDEKPTKVEIAYLKNIKPYISGEFYKRELPCILTLLEQLEELPKLIIVDGYVFLSQNKMGLGAYLSQSLNHKIPIIGVAKSPFSNISTETYLFRGVSKKPLYISSIGLDLKMAKKSIKNMGGKYRIPTLLKEVDRVCRLR